MVTEVHPLSSIIYTSTATGRLGDDDLVELLETSRRNNAGDDLTGMLLYRDGRFLQVIEGPSEPLRARMAVIAADTRHSRVQVLLEESLGERRFPDWSMGFVPNDAAVPEGLPGYLASFGEGARPHDGDAGTGRDADSDGHGAQESAPLRSLISWFEHTATNPQ